jgi:ATP-dependent RNA helicase RhlE
LETPKNTESNTDTVIEIESLNLLEPILTALKKKGYKTLTPIQSQAIPHLLNDKDVIGIAQTGTGKTAAFALPIIQKLASNKKKVKPARMRALILTPTRELASQINENIVAYGKGLALSSSVIFGGVNAKPQILNMKKGQQILVATPGRLIDLMNEGYIKYDQLEVFVLDEADRMLDMGFIHDVKRIINKLPKVKQTVLFSATMSKEIEKIASGLLKDPVKVEVTPQATTVERIEQSLVYLPKQKKPLLLIEIIRMKKIRSALVFSRTKHGCDRIVKRLEARGVKAAAIHGNKSQNARERALKNFKDGNVTILVATDIAARGIDIPHVSYVFNYDVPSDPSSYVHRIGRTARAGREGMAIMFCDDTEGNQLKSVEKLIKQEIAVNKELTAISKTIKIDNKEQHRRNLKNQNNKSKPRTGVSKKRKPRN